MRSQKFDQLHDTRIVKAEYAGICKWSVSSFDEDSDGTQWPVVKWYGSYQASEPFYFCFFLRCLIIRLGKLGTLFDSAVWLLEVEGFDQPTMLLRQMQPIHLFHVSTAPSHLTFRHCHRLDLEDFPLQDLSSDTLICLFTSLGCLLS